MDNQPQSVIMYRSQYDYQMQNNPEYQDAWVFFMFWVIMACVAYCAFIWVKERFFSNRFGRRSILRNFKQPRKW